MTRVEMRDKLKELALKHGIAIYEAAQLMYVAETKKESEAKKAKELLKEFIKAEYARQDIKAHAVLIPNTDQFATGYAYQQNQPRWDDELAHKLVPAELLAQFHRHEDVNCFTVVRMSESASKDRVAEANSVDGVTDTTGSKGSKE